LIDYHRYIDACQYVFEGGSAVARKTATQMSVAADACCSSVLAAPLSQSDSEVLARGFAALADPVRLRLLSLIAASGDVCSCDLLEPLGKSQPTVSHHTKALADAGLIAGDKRGRWVYWNVVPERVEALRQALATA
jgi:ArsR family transcriptional regulator